MFKNSSKTETDSSLKHTVQNRFRSHVSLLLLTYRDVKRTNYEPSLKGPIRFFVLKSDKLTTKKFDKLRGAR